MKLYLLGGLGADARVFHNLNVSIEFQIIDWIEPEYNESLESYAQRLAVQINEKEPFGLLGVSFGGIVCLEIAKCIEPQLLILISSVETHTQLPRLLIALGKLGLLKMIPTRFIKPPNVLMQYLFSAKNKSLLGDIIHDTKPEFIKWALNSIIEWKNNSNNIKPIRIHGTSDRLIPLKGEAITIHKGGHFMIVDLAEKISAILNAELSRL